MRPDRFAISPQVRQALAERRPVVALESTIIAHGMPYPENIRTAEAVEQIVRDAGAVPATIGIVHGHVTVGTYQTEDYPLFYSRHSGHASPWVVNSVEEVAAAFRAKSELGMEGGMLIAVPVPEGDALPEDDTAKAVEAALAEIARDRSI